MLTTHKTLLMSVASVFALTTAACAKDSRQEAAQETDVIAEEISTAEKTEDVSIAETSMDDTLEVEEAPSDFAELEGGINDVASLQAEVIDSYSTEAPIETASLSRDDTIALSKQKFAMADIDGDGALSQEEFVSMSVSMTQTLEVAMAETDVLPAPEDLTNEELGMEALPEVTETDAETVEAVVVAAGEKFAEISADGQPVTEEKIIEETVEDFEIADADGDDIIEGAELVQFAEMTAKPDTKTNL